MACKNDSPSNTNVTRTISPPESGGPVLLHSCCAPCSGELMEQMVAADIPFSIFFYNPNIHPKAEYEIRKSENIRFARDMNIAFIDADYDTDAWFTRVNGLEWEPERGARCSACFDMRFERTALFAHENGFPTITSSLGLSRWKDMTQINGSGTRAAARYNQVSYWTYNWRLNGGAARMYTISKREQFYKQEYCGCVYSLRDTNKHRKKKNKKPIAFGNEFYTESGAEPLPK